MDPEERNKSEDERLSEIAAMLRRPEETPGLWDRIEQDLLRRQERTPLERHVLRRRNALRKLAGLAAAVLVTCALVLILHQDGAQPSLLLDEDEAMLAEIQKSDIEKELARLEPLFHKEMAARSEEVPILSGHLEILDSAIDTCQKAWQKNRLNRGVQRALLFSYQKKLEILRNFISARG